MNSHAKVYNFLKGPSFRIALIMNENVLYSYYLHETSLKLSQDKDLL